MASAGPVIEKQFLQLTTSEAGRGWLHMGGLVHTNGSARAGHNRGSQYMSLRLEDLENIRQAKARYCRFLDTKAFDQWERLFSPEARITFYNPDGTVAMEFQSIAEFSTLTRDFFAATITVHQTHNSEIDFVSDSTARAIWSMEDWHIYPAGSPHRTLHGYGFYYETWEKRGDDWKITRLELKRQILDIT
jgi:hypothetical protein